MTLGKFSNFLVDLWRFNVFKVLNAGNKEFKKINITYKSFWSKLSASFFKNNFIR
jgi:hypothetical protein